MQDEEVKVAGEKDLQPGNAESSYYKKIRGQLAGRNDIWRYLSRGIQEEILLFVKILGKLQPDRRVTLCDILSLP